VKFLDERIIEVDDKNANIIYELKSLLNEQLSFLNIYQMKIQLLLKL